MRREEKRREKKKKEEKRREGKKRTERKMKEIHRILRQMNKQADTQINIRMNMEIDR